MRKTNNRYKGDQLGNIDEYGIAQWYPKCKVRKEGDHYIATPHTTNPTRRTIRKPKEIAVSIKDGKYALEKPQDKPLNDSHTQDEQSIEPTDKSLSKAKEQSNNGVRITTRKQIFDELYDKYYKQKPHIR